MQRSSNRFDTDRGQSETFGVVLLLGMAVLGAVTVAATGYAALTRDSGQVGMAQAELSLSQFDARTSDVALGRSESARVDIGLPDTDGTMGIRPEDGWIRVRITGGNPPDEEGYGGPSPENPDSRENPVDEQRRGSGPSDKLVVNVTLSSVTYQHGMKTVGYQAGGLFRSDGTSSTLVSRPELNYRSRTLTIPIIRIEGKTRFASTVQATHGGSVRKFPDPERGLTNSVEDRTVTVTVKSKYYQAWGEYFEEQTPGSVTVNNESQTATVVFESGSESQLEFLHTTVHNLSVTSR